MKRIPSLPKQAKRILVALVGLIVIMLWTSGILTPKQAPGSLPSEPGATVPSEATVLTLQPESVPNWVSLSGTVHSEQHIQISARLAAYVHAVHVSPGSSVEQDQLLLELDPREIQQQRAAAMAELEQAETAFRRATRLLENEATTPQAYEVAEAAFKAAQAQAQRIEVLLSYTRVQAPIAGIVSDRFIEPGDLASPGQKLLTLYDPTRLRLEVPVPASLISYFPVGRTLPVQLDLASNTSTGTVREVVSAFDPVTRTRRVKLTLQAPNAAVLPGMYGTVHVPAGTQETLLLPPHAVRRSGQLESVQVVAEDGFAYRRLIRTGPRHQDRVTILSGLLPGEKVLIPPAPQPSGTSMPSATTKGKQ